MEFSEERIKRYLTEAEGYLELATLDSESGLSDPELLEAAQSRLDEIPKGSFLKTELALMQGSIHRERQAYGEAIPFFRSVLEDEPGHPLATVGLGWCLKRTGRLVEALAPYMAAIEQHPKMALLHYNLACYLSLLGRTAESLSSLEHAFRLEDELRKLAVGEEDFEPIRSLPEFQRLVRG